MSEEKSTCEQLLEKIESLENFNKHIDEKLTALRERHGVLYQENINLNKEIRILQTMYGDSSEPIAKEEKETPEVDAFVKWMQSAVERWAAFGFFTPDPNVKHLTIPGKVCPTCGIKGPDTKMDNSRGFPPCGVFTKKEENDQA